MKKFYSASYLILIILFLFSYRSSSQDTIPAGSYIINMGVVPQTIGNGLKPYGLVYELVKTYKVPVKWVINTGKAKDGIDFSHNGVDYKGGTFIVPFEFRTPAINAAISSWESQGVVGNTSVSQLVLDVYKTIYYAPNWTMDKANGAIAAQYFTNAGIPSSSYGGDSSSWKTPDQLNACDDIFVLPHADPTWATHSNLYYWNLNHRGNLWAACHAVSELENITDPADTIQMNFLTTGGLVHWSDHRKDASPPYLYQDHGHGIMQFMQIMDEATNIGSEKTYLPKAGSSWRSSTTLGVYDTSNKFIPSLSDGPAAIVAYGHAYGDVNRGWVMYEAGHDHNGSGTLAEQVAAQRAFFNYSFFVAVDRYATFDTEVEGLPDVLIPNQPYNLTFNVPPGIDLSYYTIEWTSSCGGSFSSTGSQSVTFTPPTTNGACIITVSITDGCGREQFSSKGAFINSVLPLSSVALQGGYQSAENIVRLQWSERNNQSVAHYEIQRNDNGGSFRTIALFFPEEKSGTVIYHYNDPYAVDGAAHYRLQVHNRSGAVSLSNMVTIVTGESKNPQVTLLGNPTRGAVSFEYRSPATGNITAAVVDMNGRVIGSRTLAVQKGLTIINMGNFSSSPAGTYLLRIITDSKTIIQKLQIVQ